MSKAALIPRFFSGLLALLAAAGLPGAQAASIPIDKAPAAWVRYAEDATRRLTGWLNDADSSMPNLRAALAAMGSGAEASTPPLLLKVWVDRQGTISRIESEQALDTAAKRELMSLKGRHLAAAPPRRMRLPMRIAIRSESVLASGPEI